MTLTAPEDANENSEDVTVILTASNAPLQTQTVTVIDNDTRILIGGADSVLEGGEAIVTVSLSGSPGISRTVSLSSSNTLGGTITPATLTFSPSSFSSSIAITGVQDANAVNEATSVSGSGTGLLSGSKNISIIDDDTVNFDIVGGTQILEGGSLSLQVRLTYAPASNLTVNVSSADTGSVTAASSTLTFTPANYNVYQTLVLNGVEDINETSENVNISFSASGVPSRNYTVTTLDNDTRPVFGGNFTVPEESFSVATVVLSANPGTSRTVTLSSLNTNAVTVSPSSLIFNENNWNSPQSIILAGVADSNTVSEAVTIRAVTGTVTVDQMSNTQDNDTLAMILTDGNANSIPNGTVLNINEGSSMTFKIKFNYEPSSPVTVNFSNPLTPLNVQLLTFSPASLTFNSANYSIEQTVTVTAVENDYIDDKSTSISFNPTGGFTGSRTISVLVKDNDPIVHKLVANGGVNSGLNPFLIYNSYLNEINVVTRNNGTEVPNILQETGCPLDLSICGSEYIFINYTRRVPAITGNHGLEPFLLLDTTVSPPVRMVLARDSLDSNTAHLFKNQDGGASGMGVQWHIENRISTEDIAYPSAVTDSVNNRLIVAARSNTDSGRLVLFDCELNGMNCNKNIVSTTSVFSGFNGFSISIDYVNSPKAVYIAGSNEANPIGNNYGATLWKCPLNNYASCQEKVVNPAYGSGSSLVHLIDNVSVPHRIILVGQSPEAFYFCSIDLSSCISKFFTSGIGLHYSETPSLSIDTVNNKLLSVFVDYSQDSTAVIFRCDMNGMNCKSRNITKQFGLFNGTKVRSLIVTSAKKIILATENRGMSSMLSIFSIPLYIEDP